MKRAWLNIFLMIVLGVLWVLFLLIQQNSTKRNFRFIPQMEDSLAFETQREIFPYKRNLAETIFPPGSIPRGMNPISYQANAFDARRAGLELKNPYSISFGTDVKRGANLFENFCAVCHGKDGLGSGPVVKRGVPAPPSLLAENALRIPDGQIFHILTYGQGNMPPYAAQISQTDRWLAVSYVRLLQKNINKSDESGKNLMNPKIK